MYELMGKLQLRDLNKKQLEKGLSREEYTYDQIVANLSKAKQERRHHAKQLQNERKAKQREVDAVEHNLQMARAMKQHEIGRLEDLQSERLELEAEERQLIGEIADYEKAIERDSTMIGSLDTEIEKLE